MHTKTTIQILEGSEENRLIHLNQENQCFSLQIQGITINYCFPSGKWDHGTIILFYEPNSQFFGWHFITIYTKKKTNYSHSQEQIDRFLKENHVYLLSTKMILFVPRLHTQIWFREFEEQYSSLEEARQQLFLTLEDKLGEIEWSPTDIWYRKISIQRYLNWRFWNSREHRKFRQGWVKLTRVTYQNSQWKLELDSVDEKHPIVHKYGAFNLDNNYNVIKVLGDCVTEKPVKLWKKDESGELVEKKL